NKNSVIVLGNSAAMGEHPSSTGGPSEGRDLALIVGLGNPGRDYARTRHNAGFMVLEQLAGRWRASLTAKKKFHGRLGVVEKAGQKLLLCQPETFMNASGQAVQAVSAFYRVAVARTLVVLD